MQPTKTMSSKKEQLFILIACLFLFMGIGRIFTLVGHNPVLAYANSYDMIRLQACHQIWPADKFVNITTGTPAAPLRRYTLDKHVDTPCFPSSELIFTSIGIELGKLKNLVSGESLISIKTIGFVKALFLSLTALIVSIYFYRKQLYVALLTNATVMLMALSDPGVTLYLNTFYTEFSAVYFLYIALVGVVIWAQAHYRALASWLLLIGLVGLGFSKPQHMALACSFGVMLSVYALYQENIRAIPAILLCASLPLLLQISGGYTPRNASMIRVENINVVGSLLSRTPTPRVLLADLGLPESCQVLAGKNGYNPILQQKNICPEVSQLSTSTVLLTLTKHPLLFAGLIASTLEQQKNWIVDLYGQVERERYGSVSNYQRSIANVAHQLPKDFFSYLFAASLLVAVIATLAHRNPTHSKAHHYLFLLLGVLTILIVNTVLQSGLVGVDKNIQLCLPLTVTLVLVIFFVLATQPLQPSSAR